MDWSDLNYGLRSVRRGPEAYYQGKAGIVAWIE
jgi:hypothetical protein